MLRFERLMTLWPRTRSEGQADECQTKLQSEHQGRIIDATEPNSHNFNSSSCTIGFCQLDLATTPRATDLNTDHSNPWVEKR